jgi:hypothetical protein
VPAGIVLEQALDDAIGSGAGRKRFDPEHRNAQPGGRVSG